MGTESMQPSNVRQSVADAVRVWQHGRTLAQERAAAEAEPINYPPAETILKSIPRREQLIPPDSRRLWMPYLEPLIFKKSFWKSLGRLFTWISLVNTIVFGTFFDRLLRRDSEERQAVRLRLALERAGGTFVKLGQQIAMRIDLVPWAYCVELSKMLDRMPPFSSELALQAIERTIGRPWQDVFAVFDPKPVGSASMACVYQAMLKNGTKVVVKIRRPGIAEMFQADLQVLDWLSQFAEFLTIIRPGFTRHFRTEVREIVQEELDFRREGRFQDIFRRNAKKSGQDFFTSPQVYFEYSGDEVLVQEFVTGLWLWEVIALVEQDTVEGRRMLRELNIDPKLVARRILWTNFWSCDEHVFFHGDPHPANILITPNSKVTFIDFGSCGSFNNQQLVALEQIVLAMQNRDVESMTRAAISLMEPLPPVDVPALVKQIQEEYMRLLHTFNTPSEYTEYWERTSARQWLVLMRVAQNFNLPMNLHMLRMIRATLLYDSIVLRLDTKLDRYHEYTEYMKDRAQLVKLRWRERARENAGDGFFLYLEEIGKSFNDLMIRAQSMMGRPIVNLGSTVDKWIFTVSVLSRMAARIILVTILGMVLINILLYIRGEPILYFNTLGLVLQDRFYQLFLVAATIFNVRHILFRLMERDTKQ
jgi:predicted unusual protein kinase regulating ubiquinone biosynthesis (AarF/ABC1/UbiB family)